MKRTRGFTLVEIMIVVAIVVALGSIAIPNLMRAYLESKQAMARSTLKTISSALEQYAGLVGIYPPETTSLNTAGPPYLSVDYFTGTHNSYTYTSNLSDYSYTITATPGPNITGATTYTVITGGVITP